MLIYDGIVTAVDIDDRWMYNCNMLDITEDELNFCSEYVRTRDPVKAIRAGNMIILGKDPAVLAEYKLEEATIRYVIGIMDRVWGGGEIEVDIEDEKQNKRRIVGDLRKVGRSAAQDRAHESAIKALEIEGKVLGVITEKKDVSIGIGVMKDPSRLSMQEMKRLLSGEAAIESDFIDVTPH